MARVSDLTGQKFGRLTVISRAENKSGRTNWHCRCDCGNEKDVLAINLARGTTKSCGCLNLEKIKERSFKDLTDKRFGRLVAICVDRTENGKIYWRCKCDCGKFHVVLSNKLISGNTISCGCYRKENVLDKIGELNKTHGKYNTRLYRIYEQMKGRCYTETSRAYERWGGRGITVCKEWLGEHGFENFYNWAMANGYDKNLTLDRKNNSKGYSPDNCRWATAKQQANNTRSTVFLTYKGEIKPASEWSEITGIRQATLTRRKRSGWTDEQCIETKVGEKRK